MGLSPHLDRQCQIGAVRQGCIGLHPAASQCNHDKGSSIKRSPLCQTIKTEIRIQPDSMKARARYNLLQNSYGRQLWSSSDRAEIPQFI